MATSNTVLWHAHGFILMGGGEKGISMLLHNSIYHRSGNFRVRKLSYDKFVLKNFCSNDSLPR